MTITTAVPPPVWTGVGFIVPASAAVVNGALADLNNAFGGALNTQLDTPQGQLASSLAAIYLEVQATFLKYTQQVDPAFADGRMQDAIARIYFLERNPSQPTVVQALCTGDEGVVIPVGALAVNLDGNLYQATQAGTIPVGGSITLPFACTIPGPIPCPTGSLDKIYQVIPGWDQINNADPGVTGNDVESRAAFEARREATVAANSVSVLQSILGAVWQVPDVIDVYVTENDNDTPTVIGGVTLAPHSLYVAVVGGDSDAIAQAIWSKKAPGCSYNGNTTVVVLDQSSQYSPPYPAYDVTYETPSDLNVFFAVNIANSPLVPANAASLIQAAVASAFSGGDGGSRARIGGTIYASRFYAPVLALGSWAQIISIQVGSTNALACSFTGSIAGGTLSVSAVASGAIAAGQILTDPAGHIAPGTTIVSGAGSTWSVSISQTVTSESMETLLTNLNDLTAQIDQEPVTAAGNVLVTIT